MAYELFIALRYLRAKRRQAAVSVITGIATAGIAVGVAALIVALALMVGFRTEVQEKILEGTAHLNLLRPDNRGIGGYRELVERVRAVPGVRAASATTYTSGLLSVGDRQEHVVLKGVDLTAPQAANEVFATTVEGDPAALAPPPGAETADGIVIGKELARALALRVGETVTVVTAQARLTPLGLQPRPRYTRFRVVGIFASGLYDYDSKWAYISLPAAQRLSGSGDTAGVIQMKVDEIDAVGEIGARVRAVAGPDFMTTNWQELNRPLFAALSLQQKVIIIFFTLLIAIAALNIVTTLTMSVIEKHRDIAILRAQGATPQAIMRIFMLQGVMIGLVGATLGLGLGLGLAWLANAYQLVSIPAEIYSVSYVRLKVRPLHCSGIALLAAAISLLATIYPARAAARLAPVEALRYE